MSSKVEKITDWKQLINKPKIGKVQLNFPDGSAVDMEVRGLSKATIEAINEKWDDKKKSQPTDYIRVGNAPPKLITLTEGEEYDKWVKDCQALDNMKIAHTALEFLVVKPEPAEGLTGDDAIANQIKQLNDVLLFGHFADIVKAGYGASGIELDQDKVEQAKNY